MKIGTFHGLKEFPALPWGSGGSPDSAVHRVFCFDVGDSNPREFLVTGMNWTLCSMGFGPHVAASDPYWSGSILTVTAPWQDHGQRFTPPDTVESFSLDDALQNLFALESLSRLYFIEKNAGVENYFVPWVLLHSGREGHFSYRLAALGPYTDQVMSGDGFTFNP